MIVFLSSLWGGGLRADHSHRQAVEVFDIAAGDDDDDDDDDDDGQQQEGPGARRCGPSRNRRGQSAAMTERIADSREEAGLPRYSEAAEFHYARREAGTRAPEDLPRDPHAAVEHHCHSRSWARASDA